MCASADCLNVVDVLTIGFLYAHLVATLLGFISLNPCRSVRVDVGLVFVVIDTSSLSEHTHHSN